MSSQMIEGFLLGFGLGGLILYLMFRGKDREIVLLKQSHEEALKQQKTMN